MTALVLLGPLVELAVDLPANLERVLLQLLIHLLPHQPDVAACRCQVLVPQLW